MPLTPLGILGGSFNPPHRGHLALARGALASGLVSRVVLIPAAMPPHKLAPAEADAGTRLAMTRLLAAEDPRLLTDDLELRRSGPSYTLDTVRTLLARRPLRRHRLIIGSDMAKIFASWHGFRELLELAPPLIAERPDAMLHDLSGDVHGGMSPDEIRVMEEGRFPMPPVDISSTKVRALFAGGASDAEMLELLTCPVLAFIRERGLYAG